MIAEKVEEIIRETVDALGFVLVDSLWVKKKKRSLLKVVIYNPEKDVSTQDCVKVSDMLSQRMDIEDIIPDAYEMIVESPGVDRQLKKKRDYEIFKDKMIRFVLKEPKKFIKKGDSVVGMLEKIDDNGVSVKVKNEIYEFEYADIAKANLYFDIKKYL